MQSHQKEPRKKSRTTKSFESNYAPSIFLQPIKVPETFLHKVGSYLLDKLVPINLTHKDSITLQVEEINAAIAKFERRLKLEKLTTKDKSEIIKNLKLLRAERKKLTYDHELEQLRNDFKTLERQIKTLRSDKDILQKKITELQEAKKEIDPKLTKQKIEILKQIDDLLLKKVELVAENIRRHAARRFDLLFLFFVAVYNTKLTITKSKTTAQYGKGSKKYGTAACHDSLFPGISFKTQPGNLQPALSSLLTQTSNTVAVKNTADALEELIEVPLLKDKHFHVVSNMTTELPDDVNRFDLQMEMKGRYRSSTVRIAIGIANRVAAGEIDPIQAMDEMCEHLNNFFIGMKQEYIDPPPDYNMEGLSQIPKTFAKIHQYEREGFFWNIHESSLTVKRSYFKPWGFVNIDNIFNNRQQRFMQIQQDILTSDNTLKSEKVSKTQ